MPKSETPVIIFAALAKAQAEMEPALKKADNPHLRKKYADLGSVQEACLEPLRRHGFAVFQPVGRDEHGLHVRTVLAHESGETLECTVPLLIAKNDMQGLGSAITYARRYGLLCMSGVAPEDDDGQAAVRSRQEAPQKQQVSPASRQQPAPKQQPASAAAPAPAPTGSYLDEIANEPSEKPRVHDPEEIHGVALDTAQSRATLDEAAKRIANDPELDEAALYRLRIRYTENVQRVEQLARDLAGNGDER